jgi:UDP-N-acetylmuramoylalanine--D-glutamate ligase
MKIGILGMARSGISAAKKALSLGNDVFLSDSKSESEIPESKFIKENFNCEFGGHSDKLFNMDMVIVSPGIPLNVPIIKKLNEKKIKLIGEIEYGFMIKDKKSKIIAVTGSNGKSTTVSLIAHILNELGYNTILAGNIGDAFTSFDIEKPGIDYIVLELSSFQLELVKSFKADIAMLLNITPDHLNRYETMKDYALAKMNIFKNQTAKDLAVINADDEYTAKMMPDIKSRIKKFSIKKKADIYLNEGKIIFGDKKYKIKNEGLQGPHNAMNVMATILGLDFLDITFDDIIKNTETFTPLQHRLEFVAEKNGVKFYNDSKATNTDAVKYALQSFDNKVRIILGGSDKGEDFSVLKMHCEENNIPYEVYETNIFEVGKEKIRKNSSYCSFFSRMRRGALYNYALKYGYNNRSEFLLRKNRR